MLAAAARARAALDGRDYVIPDDVKALALPALRHRLMLSPAAEIEARNADQIVTEHHRADGGAALMFYPTRLSAVMMMIGAPVGALIALVRAQYWTVGLIWMRGGAMS